jgi:hypothetical protein
VTSAVGLVMGAILTSIFAAVGLAIIANTLVSAGYTLNDGLWALIPILFPFVVIAVILIGIFAFFRSVS